MLIYSWYTARNKFKRNQIKVKGIDMIRKTLGFMPVLAMLAAGCTTIPQPQPPRDIEPALVGVPIGQRITESQNDINNQLFLLAKLNTGQKVGSYDVVTHNNNLDARLGSDQTLPQAYAKGLQNKNNTAQNSVTVNKTDGIKESVTSIQEPVIQKVKRIAWDDNSLNKLADNLAKAMGYELVIKGGTIADKNIKFVATDMTLTEVVTKLKAEVAPFADIVVIDKNKTFNIFYK